jgi:cell division protein FtsW (lipid II flippase)
VAVTYTSALDRESRFRVESARRLGEDHLLLALTSLVTLLAIALAVSGRVTPRAAPNISQPTVESVNLNAIADSRVLEPLLKPAFVNAADSQLAATQLLQFVRSRQDAQGALPNAGAILGATVRADVIDHTRGVVEYSDRLRAARAKAASAGAPAPVAIALFTSADLALVKPSLTVRTPQEFARSTLLWALLYVVGFWAVALLWWVRGVRGDAALLAAAHLLTGVGLAVLVGRPDPLRDTLLHIRYVEGVAIGLSVFFAASLLNVRKAAYLALSYVPLVVALMLSVTVLIFGAGPGGSNAKVNLGPVQPIEAIRLLLALFLAGYFARRWEVLRQVRATQVRGVRIPGWLHVPRVEYLLPLLVGVATALVFFFLQKDLGPALLLSGVFLATYAVARNRIGLAAAGFMALLAGFYVGYRLDVSSTLAARVHMWQSPWDNAVRGGDQIAQAMWALSTGGLSGTGLGLGDTRYLPAGHTDLVLAAIGEELGLLGLVSVAGVFLVIARRGFSTTLRAGNDYGFFLATTMTLFLVLPVLVMSAGMLGIVPLTGVVTPFLSYGGSAMVANFAALGILSAIRTDGGSPPPTQPFRLATRYLAGSLAVAAVALLAVLVDVQVVRADAYVIKPHLGLQADGVRRYQYNPRVLDLLAMIPRGTIYDRTGLPLATSDDAIAQRARDAYAKLGVPLDASCSSPVRDRCYPLGGATFHLLGDARTRRNWSASNTSYAERDLQDRLRGFDDRATNIVSTDSSGRSTTALRRDYRDLVPLLRHRYQPHHPAVSAFLRRNRDVRLTVDARLQTRLMSILAQSVAKSSSGRAAAIVIDPDTGDLLASASYPFPTSEVGESDARTAEWLDRARYGLYPPGSTFKIITAAAALREDPALAHATFMCTRMSDGRVGTRIPGWAPVRDDVLDSEPHGMIDMHQAFARSCNAYFAQLAVRIGARELLDTASVAGVSVAKGNAAARLHVTLPYAGYGQGDVVATPLRMARVVAAIATDGALRDINIEHHPTARAETSVLVSPQTAALLRQFLRDVVLSGTGRSLRDHPLRIAGKTGTAEVTGAPSHAWFVGFAPFGSAEKRIAFAVVVENAGYGGRAAAPAAGEIVTAAAASGLVRE